MFGVFWTPEVIFDQANDIRMILFCLTIVLLRNAEKIAICLLKILVKFTFTFFWGSQRHQKAVGRFKRQSNNTDIQQTVTNGSDLEL